MLDAYDPQLTKKQNYQLHQPTKICSKIIKAGELYYQCDCFTDEDTVMCVNCFNSCKEKHKNHRYQVKNDSASFCDCGTEFVPNECWCDYHLNLKDGNDLVDKIHEMIKCLILTCKTVLMPPNIEELNLNDSSFILFLNHTKAIGDLEFKFKTINCHATYQDASNIISKLQYNQFYVMQPQDIKPIISIKQLKEHFDENWKFWILSQQTKTSFDDVVTTLPSFLSLIDIPELRNYISDEFLEQHLPDLPLQLEYCKDDWKQSNHLNYLMYYILKFLPPLTSLLCDCFALLSQDDTFLIALGDSLIAHYKNHIKCFLDGYSTISYLSPLFVLTFQSVKAVSNFKESALVTLFQYASDFQTDYDKIVPGQPTILPKKREAINLVLINYKDQIVNLIKIYQSIFVHQKRQKPDNEEKASPPTQEMEVIEESPSQGIEITEESPPETEQEMETDTKQAPIITADNTIAAIFSVLKNLMKSNTHAETTLQIYDHIELDIVSPIQGPMFRPILYQIVSDFYKLFIIPSSTTKNIKKILSEILKQNSDLCETIKNTNTEHGYVFFLFEYLFGSMLSKIDSTQFFDIYSFIDENNNDLLMFGAIRYFKTILQHKANMWTKNGLMFTVLVKASTQYGYAYEAMTHYFQFILSYKTSEAILQFLLDSFDLQIVEDLTKLDNFQYYYQFLSFLLVLITNPIITSDNWKSLRIDLIHILIVSPKTLNDIMSFVIKRYVDQPFQELKKQVEEELEIISDCDSQKVYILKSEYHYWYNPFYLGIQDQNLTDFVSQKHSEDWKPFPVPDCPLMNIFNVINTKGYAQLIDANLAYIRNNDKSNTAGFLLQTTLYMLTLKFNSGDKLNSIDPIQLSILYKYEFDSVFGGQVQFLLQKCRENKIGIQKDNEMSSQPSSDSLHEKAKKRGNSILEKMKAKQKKFSELPTIQLDLVDKDQQLDSQKPSCLICKTQDTISEKGPLVFPVLVYPTSSYVPSTIINDWLSGEARTPLLRYKVTTCFHVVHLQCLNTSSEHLFFQKVLSQSVSAADVKKREYTCPTCRGLYNYCLILPNDYDNAFFSFPLEGITYFPERRFTQPPKRKIMAYQDKEKNYYIVTKTKITDDKNNTFYVPIASLGATPLLNDTEIIKETDIFYSMVTTTLLDAAFSISQNKQINCFLIKSLLLNTQYFLSTTPHEINSKKFLLQDNPERHLETLIYALYTCSEPMIIWCRICGYLYECLCSYLDAAYPVKQMSKSKQIQTQIIQQRKSELQEINKLIGENNDTESFFASFRTDYRELFTTTFKQFNFHLKIAFVLYNSFNSTFSNPYLPDYDFYKALNFFNISTLITEGATIPAKSVPIFSPIPTIEISHLKELPNTISDLLIAFYKPCSCCKTIPPNLGLCLMCWSIMCIAQPCCEHDKIGEATQHCTKYHGGVGMILSLQNFIVFLIRNQYSCEYIQLYNERDNEIDFRRKYDMLQHLFQNNEIFSTVFQTVEVKPTYIAHNAL